MKYYTIGEFANKIGKTVQTVRNWDKNGRLKPHHVSEGGHRYYSQEQLNRFLGLHNNVDKRKTIGYCRVSSNQQKDDLERQIENVKTYMYAKGYQFEIITDVGNGVDYNKEGLNQLIDEITTYQVDKIIILNKDVLVGFSYELIEIICKKFGTEIEIIDNTLEDQELVEDLIQIITIFRSRLQGKYVNQLNKMIKELENDSSKES